MLVDDLVDTALPILPRAEQIRRRISPQLDPKCKVQLGQFMTPAGVAQFMASLFPDGTNACHLLDAGAGVGALSCAFLDRWQQGGFSFQEAQVTAVEIDDLLRQHLADHLASYTAVTAKIVAGDFINLAVQEILDGRRPYTHVILNPPYKKMGSQTTHRHRLREVGIETVNLYSAFVALGVALAAPGGQLVAIVPRSFCNGPYYRPFREFILKRAALQHIHLFDSRSKTFQDDDVLQENVIIRLEVGGTQGTLTVTTSTDDSFSDLQTSEQPFSAIVQAGDAERFIHIPTTSGRSLLQQSAGLTSTLADLGLKVSTGPVVDFRLREHLRQSSEEGTVPLLYPVHLQGGKVTWPKASPKANAICRNGETEKWLYPSGYYCVVKRFSSKEELRRISATAISPADFGEAKRYGFENHLNVLHCGRQGLTPQLAQGLALYLNSFLVDEYFRRFNGHTQVNATDLKQLPYPSATVLEWLGEWVMSNPKASQDERDSIVKERIQ